MKADVWVFLGLSSSMMSTGDVHGGLRTLEALLRAIKYPGEVDYNGLRQGDPSAVLPLVSFTLTSFSPPFTERLLGAGLELTGKSDLRFTDALYKVLRDVLHYQPVLNKQQFLQRVGFSQRKVSMVCDIINLVLHRHKQLVKAQNQNRPAPRSTSYTVPPRSLESFSVLQPTCRHRASCRGGGAAPSQVDVVVSRPLIAHTEMPPPSLTNSSHSQAQLSPDWSDPVSSSNRPEEPPAAPLDPDPRLQWVEERLSAVESRLDQLVLELRRLDLLEKRLQDIESSGGTEKVLKVEKVEGVVSISRSTWENLMSRLDLLETQLELNGNAQAADPLPHLPHFCSSSSSSVKDASEEGIKNSLERITSMMKSTSSLLKTSDSLLQC